MAILPPDPVFCFKSDMGHIHSLCYAAKNDNYCPQLLAATEKGLVYFWDLETNRQQYKQEMGVSIQAVHHFDDNIITQEKSGLIKLWSIKKSSYKTVSTYQACGGFCKSILVNSSLIVPQEDGAIDILDVKSMSKVQRLVPNREELGMLTCLRDINLEGELCLLGGYESGDIIMWDLNTFKPCSHIKLQEFLTSICFDRHTNRAVCCASSNLLQLFYIDKSYTMCLKTELPLPNDGCNVIRMRQDGKVFVSGGWDGRLRIYSCKSLRTLAVLTEHKASITDIQYSPSIINYWNANIMAASTADGVISLWNLYNNF